MGDLPWPAFWSSKSMHQNNSLEYELNSFCFCKPVLAIMLHIELMLLQQFADNSDFQNEWASAKMANKQRLAQYILRVTGVSIDPNSLFDIQVKRIHEYKRQLLNILGAIYRYKKLKVSKHPDHSWHSVCLMKFHLLTFEPIYYTLWSTKFENHHHSCIHITNSIAMHLNQLKIKHKNAKLIVSSM